MYVIINLSIYNVTFEKMSYGTIKEYIIYYILFYYRPLGHFKMKYTRNKIPSSLDQLIHLFYHKSFK